MASALGAGGVAAIIAGVGHMAVGNVVHAGLIAATAVIVDVAGAALLLLLLLFVLWLLARLLLLLVLLVRAGFFASLHGPLLVSYAHGGVSQL